MPKPKTNTTLAQGLAKAAKIIAAKDVEQGGLGPLEIARNGKPLKASPERIAAIRDAVRKGLTIDKACILHGISRQILDRWKKANESVLQLFEQAELASEAELVDIIRKAAPEDWKAANWLLERRHGWIAATRQEITGKDGGPMQSLTIHKHLLERISKAGDRPTVNVTPKKAEDSLSSA